MGPGYSISELAEAAGVPASTVRYYERVGLVRPSGRTDANYRYYDESALERLRFIRAAQGAGFTLDDVSTLLELRDGSLEPCAEVQALIEARLDEIAEKMADFRRVRKQLEAGLALCRAACDTRRCEVIAELSRKAAEPPPGGKKPRVRA